MQGEGTRSWPLQPLQILQDTILSVLKVLEEASMYVSGPVDSNCAIISLFGLHSSTSTVSVSNSNDIAQLGISEVYGNNLALENITWVNLEK